MRVKFSGVAGDIAKDRFDLFFLFSAHIGEPDMRDGVKKSDRIYHVWGWILFIICAGFFIVSSVKDGNLFSLFGSIVFLIACFVFLVPLLSGRQPSDDR